MLKLDNPLKLDSAAVKAADLTSRFDKADLDAIGIVCLEGYKNDERSRETWMRRNEAGMDLALQVQKEKSFPWPGCANVAFPLVTIAAMQFHARAYPAIVSSTDVVKCTTFGDDPSDQLAARSDRVSTHMSWQLLYQDRCWEDQEDKSIFNLSIVGTNFKKTYYSVARGHNVSELVLAKDLVIDYWAKSVEECSRKTHRIPLFRNEVRDRVLTGMYRDILEEPWYTATPVPTRSKAQIEQDNRQGITPPTPDESSSLLFLEQHCNLDLDNDGYAEPYIITLHAESGQVVRIVTRFASEADIIRVPSGKRRGEILRINALEYFTKKTFIPSPDGGMYDLGFGVFLGPLNEAVNSLVNMLLDAGTLQTTGGGFLGRGAKIRGGQHSMAPFEWKRVDSTGDDLRKSIFPLPVNAPSDVLFQLLSLLINYASRVAGTTDTSVGENPGQNTPASSMQTMVELGQKVYTAIFKRIWRASKEEFRKLYVLNSIYLPLDTTFPGGATRYDYVGDGNEICPVADPNVTSDTMRLQMAMALKGAAATTLGYNKDAVERRFLKALRVDNQKEVFPGSEGLPQPKDPKVQVAEIAAQSDIAMKQQDIAFAQQKLQAEQQQFVIELMEERQLNQAKIVDLLAQAQESAANAQNETAYAQVALINAEIARAKTFHDTLNKRIEHLLTLLKIRSDQKIATKQIEKEVAA
tara:strand:- start:1611 stop:3692 length:2082 start_codon:yes stop_codon:yes gene_type:complete